MLKKLNLKLISIHLVSVLIIISISFIAGIYAMNWYIEYEDEKGLMDLLGGKENYDQLRTVTYKFEKVFTLANGETYILTGDDIKNIEKN